MIGPEGMDDAQIVGAYHRALAAAASARAGLGGGAEEFDSFFHPRARAMIEERVARLRAEAAGGGPGAFERLRCAMSLGEFVAQYEACRDRSADMARELAGARGSAPRREGFVVEPVPRGAWHGAGRAAGALRRFAELSPAYRRLRDEKDYTWYEADVNARWLASTSHGASLAPFSPTWLLSALAIAERASRLGYRELVDVGSGDGRVALCASLLGMKSWSVEIDPGLARGQEEMRGELGAEMEVVCADAARVRYPDMERPVFAVGGLAQMGAEAMAEAARRQRPDAGFVLAGTRAPKYGGKEPAGWGRFLEAGGLRAASELRLPTAWTAGEPEGTPYLFAGPASTRLPPQIPRR